MPKFFIPVAVVGVEPHQAPQEPSEELAAKTGAFEREAGQAGKRDAAAGGAPPTAPINVRRFIHSLLSS